MHHIMKQMEGITKCLAQVLENNSLNNNIQTTIKDHGKETDI